MSILKGQRVTLRKESVVVGVVSAVVAAAFMWVMRGEDDGGMVRARALPAHDASVATSAAISAVEIPRDIATVREEALRAASQPMAKPALPHLAHPETAKEKKDDDVASAARASAVVESVSHSTITLKDEVLAPKAAGDKSRKKISKATKSDDAQEIALLESSLRSPLKGKDAAIVPGTGASSVDAEGEASNAAQGSKGRKGKGGAGARLGLPPLAEMEKECRRASLLDSMPPSYCSCDLGEFEQMECRVSASVAKSVANN